MQYQTNKAGRIIGGAISVLLTAFTIWRTWDLFSHILPSSQMVAAIFGIAALDGGLLMWSLGYVYAKGNDQRLIAGLLAVLDFLGVGTATTLDLVLSASNNHLIAIDLSNLYIGAIILISAAVVLNVGGGILYVLADPKAKQEIRDQKAHDKINDLADSQIEQHAAMYAPQFAQVKVETWLMQARMLHGINQPFQYLQPPTVQGSGMALPPASQQTQNQPPVEQQSLLDKAIQAFGWQKPVQPSSAPVVPPQTDSTPVQPFSHTDALEQLYNDHPQAFAEMVEQIRQKSQQQPATQPPLAQPPLNTNQASQPGSQNGAH
jgi:hypothetical protein